MPRELCARCSEHNVGFYLNLSELKSWAKLAYVSGSFNDWRQDDLQMREFYRDYDRILGVRISLPDGKHVYKFIVDGSG
jgi:hypothetical protein